jgi:uncharacterized membrane protein
MTRRKLIRSLNEAARAMPPSERQKFRQFLRGAEALPDDGLPAITRGLNRRPLAGAVADALAAANVDDETAAAAIDQARNDISDEVDGVLAAADINPAPADGGGTDTGAGDAGTDNGSAAPADTTNGE